MGNATATLDVRTTGDIAEMYGAPEGVVRDILDRTGLARRIGRYRIVHADDLPLVEVALRARGYPRPTAPERVAS
jgi:hypothetical protein